MLSNGLSSCCWFSQPPRPRDARRESVVWSRHTTDSRQDEGRVLFHKLSTRTLAPYCREVNSTSANVVPPKYDGMATSASRHS